MTNIQVETIPKFVPAAKSENRWVIAKGGRASGKSWSMATLMVVLMITHKKHILCTRPVQKSIRDSSHKLIKGAIERLGLDHLFEIKRDYVVLKENHAEFIFTGMLDVKSMEGVQYVWIEEAQDATEQMLEDLSPTIRNEGSRIYATYNPKNEYDPIHVRATGDQYKDIRTVVEINWSDNKFFPEVLNDERLSLLAANKDLHDHIWDGQILKIIEGALIKQSYFNYYDVIPNIVRSVIVADTAMKAKDQHDYTVFMFAGLGVDGNIYIMDVHRGKWESIDRERQAINFWNKHKKRHLYGIGANKLEIEDAASGTDLIQRLRGDKIPVSEIRRKRSKSGFEAKFGRLMDVFIHISGPADGRGIVYLPGSNINYHQIQITDASWVDALTKECQEFTADDSHDFDDQVDCLIDVVDKLASANSGMSGFV